MKKYFVNEVFKNSPGNIQHTMAEEICQLNELRITVLICLCIVPD